jgi:RND family efflux transporter MFP subunit
MTASQDDAPTSRHPPGGPAAPPPAPGAEGPPPRSNAFLIIALVVFALGALAVVPRLRARAEVRAETQELSVPTVAVAHPGHQPPEQEVVLPASIQAFTDAPIYARTNGYLKRWYVDIGARVTAGELLAEIETPEIDEQLRQARADLDTARANLQLARITSTRYQGLLKMNSVSEQDADNAAGDFEAKKAIVQSAEYNVKRLEDLRSFQKIFAPFDGVITARNTDIGALIDSGSGGSGRELFHIAAVRKLRVYVSVPQAYSRAATPGLPVYLTLSEFPDRRFQGTLGQTASSIDTASRTLLVEIAVDNQGGELLPGAYAQAHITLKSQGNLVLLPVTALIFRSAGLQVATLDSQDRVSLKAVTLGRDFGNEVEVVAGVGPDDVVIVDPPDSLTAGQQVRVATAGKES